MLLQPNHGHSNTEDNNLGSMLITFYIHLVACNCRHISGNNKLNQQKDAGILMLVQSMYKILIVKSHLEPKA